MTASTCCLLLCVVHVQILPQAGLCVCGSLVLLSVASADAAVIAKIIVVSFVPNTSNRQRIQKRCIC